MTTTTTYPARFDGAPDLNMEDLRRMTTMLQDGELACDWGNPELCKFDNDKRAAWAALALMAFADRTFGGGVDEDFPTMISDLLADLMHLVDALALDEFDEDPHTFDGLVEKARRQYEPELRGEF